MTFISWLVGSKLGRYFSIGLMVMAAISVVLLKTFAAGARKEKLKQTQRQLKNLQEGVKNNADINNMSPDERLSELRDNWSK